MRSLKGHGDFVILLHHFQVKMEGFFEKYSEKIKENSHLAENGECIIWHGGLTKDGKYGLISYLDPVSGTWKKKKAHRFNFILFTKNFNLASDVDCSHLCHNSLCINPGHISPEPHFINNNRLHCKNERKCQSHGNFPDCYLHLIII